MAWNKGRSKIYKTHFKHFLCFISEYLIKHMKA
jgi:hypothetical protein